VWAILPGAQGFHKRPRLPVASKTARAERQPRRAPGFQLASVLDFIRHIDPGVPSAVTGACSGHSDVSEEEQVVTTEFRWDHNDYEFSIRPTSAEPQREDLLKASACAISVALRDHILLDCRFSQSFNNKFGANSSFVCTARLIDKLWEQSAYRRVMIKSFCEVQKNLC
jgi:hypothetical protein